VPHLVLRSDVRWKRQGTTHQLTNFVTCRDKSSVGESNAGKDNTGQNRKGQNRKGQNRTGQVKKEKNRTGKNCKVRKDIQRFKRVAGYFKISCLEIH
jgi:hypothetical protein